nr:DnaJ domain-containing protein [Nocardioides marinus]
MLDVDRDASSEEIRTAWRAAIADLDPSDRRFRSLNQAAEVLLDPASRAAYDAGLEGPDTAAPERSPAAVPTAEAGEEPAVVTTSASGAAPKPATRRLPLVPAWALVVLAVLAGLALTVAVVAAARAPEPVTEKGGVLLEESAEQARAAAVRAIVPVLSYDYRRLDEDAAAARSYMTSAYQDDKYDPLFSLIEDNAPETQTVVGAQVVDSAVVRTGKDRVDVLLFVDRPTTNKQVSDPVVYKDQVTVTMARVDGQWLVDGLQTSPIQE